MIKSILFQSIRFLFVSITMMFLTGVVVAMEVPQLTGRVVDTVDLFSPVEEEKIEKALGELEKETGGQMVVVTLAPLKTETVEEVGIELFDAWKIGYEKKDNGAIFILIPEERIMRLEIGYGWEGVIPDARTGDIIRAAGTMFRKNAYADGTLEAVRLVRQTVQTGELPVVPPQEEDLSVMMFLAYVFVLSLLLLLLFSPCIVFLPLFQILFSYLAVKWNSSFSHCSLPS